MSIWPAAFEIARDWDLERVLALPTYLEGGPNTHTLSLVTLGAALLLSIFPASVAFLIAHIGGVGLLGVMALTVNALLRSLGHSDVGPWAATAAVVFPLVVGQSAYLYTDLPSAALALLAIALVWNGRATLAAIALAVAVWAKPLAVVAIPAVMVAGWLRGVDRRRIALQALPLLALLPALWVPQLENDLGLVERVSRSIRVSAMFAASAPELITMLAIPIAAYFVLRGTRTSRSEWHWLAVVSTLQSCFVVFFLLNALATPGHVFIPRYAVLIVPATLSLLFVTFTRLHSRARMVAIALVLLTLGIGARGPYAWGRGALLHPTAERSLTYLDLIEERKVGLERLQDLSLEMPVAYDHLSNYAARYPQLGYVSTPITNATAVANEPRWGQDLRALPNRFAMLVGAPWLGGEWMRDVQRRAEESDLYTVTVEPIGSRDLYPLEVVIVERAPTTGIGKGD